ncbi:leucine--tRNA ligase [Candidatus Nanosyncoccus alces]|uniref:Leucine--tRNA ligase n=1 Tax=Candidatus Nanosyncoccus alces TaxID=2171997 RepID=A0ABY0FMR8_9BACT|nr:leucine--tRNA ligase [Candidatus Nanosyncoccus alces]RYC75196.1 Leucine--tRNA ligase [Candidatus Nanosyncoccus alces]
MERYEPLKIEQKWQKIWEETKPFKATEETGQPKMMLAEMFPYPSGAGLHVGHVRNFTIVDVLTRFYTQQGLNVLRPFGYDTFGLPAENYAIKTGTAPQEVTKINITNFRKQAKRLGYAIDWGREINTSDPEYYKWTQWCFLQLYKKGLAYQKESYQWWCPEDQTVLANEQVENGKCWRCGHEVEKKKMKQWFFKITEYADELLEEIDNLEWPEKIKTMQKNWIGRSTGAEIDFEVVGGAPRITVFTTRPDTIYGATFLVVAPEYTALDSLLTDDTREKVLDYKATALKKSEIERQENKEKTGVFTGSYAINPATKEKIPIWVADYVLAGYGTGAIMAVPAMDDRDHEFAEKFDLPIVETELCDRDLFGTPKTTYRMRDWLISRQRYWGCPIPIAYDKDGNPHPIPEDQLPVLIPEVDDYKPDNSGRSALAKAKDWLKVTIDGEEMTRETDTLDGYACSSWYLWRYASPHDKDAAWDQDAIKYWEPVDYYCGGDHAVAHLLYIRFWCKFFADEGYLPFREPIKRLLYNGYINAPDGKKMSKSKGNVIDPLDVINDGYGADTLRTYEMFIGPYDQDAAWDPRSVGGVYRFLNRCWTLAFATEYSKEDKTINIRHKTIKKVTEDIHRYNFNTAVAALMEYVNELYKIGATTEDVVILAKLLKPFAPHLTSEMLEKLNTNDEWPKWDEKYLVSDTVEVVVQVNGKLRAKLSINQADLSDEEKITQLALSDEKVKKYTDSGVKKTIFVPKAKILNIVI